MYWLRTESTKSTQNPQSVTAAIKVIVKTQKTGKADKSKYFLCFLIDISLSLDLQIWSENTGFKTGWNNVHNVGGNLYFLLTGVPLNNSELS